MHMRTIDQQYNSLIKPISEASWRKEKCEKNDEIKKDFFLFKYTISTIETPMVFCHVDNDVVAHKLNKMIVV